MSDDKVKFPAQKNTEFIKELREKVAHYFEVNNISRYGNLNLLIKTIFMFLLYATPYLLTLIGVIDSLYGVIICYVLIGAGKAGVGMTIMHDANHRSYSRNQRTNRWLGRSLFLLGGFPANWLQQHNTMHHGFTNIEGLDEDISPGAYLRFSPHKPLRKIHRYQYLYAWFLYGLMTIFWVTSKDFTQLNGYRKEGVVLSSKKTYKLLFLNLILSKLTYYAAFMLLPMIVLPFSWYWIILFFLIMHFTAGFILTIIFQSAHVVPSAEFPVPDKSGSMENNWAVHQLLTTSDFAPNNKLLSWLIGGLYYHIEHHLFPHISHVHYPKISKLVKDVAQKYSLPYHVQPGFFKALVEHGKMLKKLGTTAMV